MATTEMRYGFDIGGTKIEMAAYDRRLNQVLLQRVRTPTGDYGEFVACITGLVEQADRELHTRGSIGIVCRGSPIPSAAASWRSTCPA
ncbi:N-acetyl-D-glucosamine kinase [Serratia marcescens]|uniref:N-acetyl-D-glucosamine kinase n=1 Tax=Serratia marcescens TaxID=615 RepID=A0A379ZGV8_SERMA|nr:N-acetyl-D-glucosamine kinase [Serratia marcescens]